MDQRGFGHNAQNTLDKRGEPPIHFKEGPTQGKKKVGPKIVVQKAVRTNTEQYSGVVQL